MAGFTQLTSTLDVDRRPDGSSSSALSRTSLKSLCNLKTVVCGMISSLNTRQILPNVSVSDFPSPTKNLMAYRYSVFCCIIQCHRVTWQRSIKNRFQPEGTSVCKILLLFINMLSHTNKLRQYVSILPISFMFLFSEIEWQVFSFCRLNCDSSITRNEN